MLKKEKKKDGDSELPRTGPSNSWMFSLTAKTKPSCSEATYIRLTGVKSRQEMQVAIMPHPGAS